MSCPDREQIYLHAAGVLEDAAQSTLEAHLGTGCSRCNDALEGEREGLGAMALALAPIAPPPRVREELLARAREGVSRRSPLDVAPPRVRGRAGFGRRQLPAFAGVAFAAAALGFGIAFWQTQGESPEHAGSAGGTPAEAALAEATEEVAALQEQLDTQDDELAQLESAAEEAADVAQLLGAERLEVLELAATEPGSEARGRAFWDPDYRCYFRAQGLAPLADGQVYVLWMIGPDEQRHAAGVLEPEPAGGVTLFTRLPRELSPVVKSFVTAEDTPDVSEPSGPMVLLGEAPRES